MLDLNLLRNDIDFVAKKLSYRKFKINKNIWFQKEKKRKYLQTKTEKLLSKRKKISKLIGLEKSLGKDNTILKLEVKKINKLISNNLIKLKILKDEIKKYLLTFPNITADEVPFGISKNDNLEIYKWGEIREYNFPIRNHLEICKIIGGLDFSLGAKLTGTCFTVMYGKIAYLHRALAQFMLDLHTKKHGYKEYYLPYLVNQDSLYGSGQLPKFYNDLFHTKLVKKNNTNHNTYTLIPTAEVPLINLVRDLILEEDELPVKMTSHTPCFRAEANSYGKDSRGLIRVHQFDKVEIVQIVHPKTSMKVLEDITNHAEIILKLLNLPYRKILLCTSDISFSSCKTYDLEVWLPGQKQYKEISSCSNVGDFQARRIKARFRRKKDNKIKLVHTLNGSGLALGRTLVAILENYQLPDGSVEIPLVLQPYLGGLTHIR